MPTRPSPAADPDPAGPTSPQQAARALAALLASPPDLPVVAVLEPLRQALTRTQPAAALVLAPPGTGKTTLVPPLVADVLARRTDRAEAPLQVLVTQPRRLAARAAAHHLAALLGESVGGSVGYAVRGERRAGPATLIEVVTAGLLLRRLQAEPDLPGVGAVVLDEVHERSLDSDLLLALLLDARALREDLVVVAMSATADLTRLPGLLAGTEPGASGRGPGARPGTPGEQSDGHPAGAPGGAQEDEAPVIHVSPTLYPLAERWAPPPTGVARLGPRGVPREFLDHVARTTAQLATAPDTPGDVLVFVPGAGEVDYVTCQVEAAVRRTLDTSPGTRRPGGQAAPPVDVLPLHGRLPATAQDRALAPSPPGRRRVVVATAVAESSLTVPGVRVVVDSLLAREPRLDLASGASGLVTVTESRSSATQRAGRAAREASGVVVRCGEPADWARMPPASAPEILTADLARAALELAAWGTPGGAGLSWIDPPPAAGMRAATATLRRLDLVDDAGALTSQGRGVAAVPADVPVARALLAAAPLVGARQAAQAAALLSEEVRASDSDLAAALRHLRRGERLRPEQVARWRQETRRLERAVREVGTRGAGVRGPGGGSAAAAAPEGTGSALLAEVPDLDDATEAPGSDPHRTVGGGAAAATASDDVVPLVLALARPQWLARRRGPAPAPGQEARYLSVGGTGMRLPAGSPLAACQWLAVGQADRVTGHADVLVRGAAPADEQLARTVAAGWLSQAEEASWEGQTLRTSRVRRLGAIELGRVPLPQPGDDVVRAAILERCRTEGLEVLDWDRDERRAGRERSGQECSARELRARLTLLHRALGDPWPPMDEDSLLERAEEWLGPQVLAPGGGSSQAGSRDGQGGRRFRLDDVDVAAGLRLLLPWPAASRLEELAPLRLEVPSGSRVRLSYVGDQGEVLERPVLAVRVQECFGWTATPTVADGRVPVLLHLLSPALRPVAVTDDLASFWANGYPQVRSELRGRYPKHAWPEDPWAAVPTRGIARRTRN